MKIGTIGLIHTENGILPRAVQKFQMKKDAKSGTYNHSFVYIGKWVRDVMIEAAIKEFEDNQGRMVNAGAYVNPLDIYSDYHKYKTLYLEPAFEVDEDVFMDAVFQWEGTPYDFKNLLGDQILYYTLRWWWGGKNNNRAKNQMVCHELTMNIWNTYWENKYPMELVPFPNAHMAQVSDIYYSPFFKISE
jgi:hypothetical protein